MIRSYTFYGTTEHISIRISETAKPGTILVGIHTEDRSISRQVPVSIFECFTREIGALGFDDSRPPYMRLSFPFSDSVGSPASVLYAEELPRDSCLKIGLDTLTIKLRADELPRLRHLGVSSSREGTTIILDEPGLAQPKISQIVGCKAPKAPAEDL